MMFQRVALLLLSTGAVASAFVSPNAANARPSFVTTSMSANNDNDNNNLMQDFGKQAAALLTASVLATSALP
eukprot:CAMPEP_0119020400 /NCGR_PEP_ID=MMETSP1176-20130426/23972_1 /TAXON_ID=265551 /ORGANISM="Synedropsis recta cf, Strain CCMP1620" /LENGTH=71 /DNA_ID=CAMNT_0006974819 /DNA_START=8 /DNA_END=219 /DNA_ORIENTATION=+